MPERVRQRLRADLVQPIHLVRRQAQVGRGQVVGQLVLGASADDHRSHGRLGQGVRQSHLGGGNAVVSTNRYEFLDGVVELVFVIDRRLVPLSQMPAPSGGLNIPA